MNFVRSLHGAAAPLLLVCAFASAANAQDATWQTYSDAARGFSISYPPGWKVDPAFADKGYAYSQGDTDDVRHGVAFSPAGDIAPGTNLESNQLVLAVQTARPGDTCKASAFLADPPPDYFTEVQQDTPDLTHTFAQPGDMFDIERIVRVIGHTPCIAVQVYLVYSQIRPHDPNAPKPFDRVAVLGLLDRIVATMKPLK